MSVGATTSGQEMKGTENSRWTVGILVDHRLAVPEGMEGVRGQMGDFEPRENTGQ